MSCLGSETLFVRFPLASDLASRTVEVYCSAFTRISGTSNTFSPSLSETLEVDGGGAKIGSSITVITSGSEVGGGVIRRGSRLLLSGVFLGLSRDGDLLSVLEPLDCVSDLLLESESLFLFSSGDE